MKEKSESEVAQSCPTLSDPMDCSPPASSVHGIFQASVLEWGAIAFSRETDELQINAAFHQLRCVFFILEGEQAVFSNIITRDAFLRSARMA